MEWPPHSGRQMEFPEIDYVQFFDIAAARQKINAGQLPLIDELEKVLSQCSGCYNKTSLALL